MQECEGRSLAATLLRELFQVAELSRALQTGIQMAQKNVSERTQCEGMNDLYH